MIHAAIMGSTERFLALAIEHFAGAFPLWLAPVQISILSISEKFLTYAKEIESKLKDSGMRVEIPDADETLGKRIRESELKKIPYTLIVGEKEEADGTVSIRHYKRGQEGTEKVDALLEKLKKEIKEKTL
jgi:threonyl-tRNA synthetase